MKRIGNSLLLSFFLFIFSVPAFATLGVQASVDTGRVAVNDSVTLTISVISEDAVDIESPNLDRIEGFRLDQTWESTSVSQKMVSTPSGMDWQKQRRKDFNYTLTALQEGRLTIPGIEVRVDGKTFRTQPIMIEVTQDAPANQRKRGRNQEPLPPGFNWPGARSFEDLERMEEELFNQLLNRRMRPMQEPHQGGGQRYQAEPQLRTLPTNPNEAFFVQIEVDKMEVYEGEQVTVSWYIYTRGQMESLDRVKFPDLKGFWKEIIEEVPSIQFTEEIINGVPYRKALLASHALFPIKPGTAVIDEYKIKSRIRMPHGAYGMALGKANEYTRSSKRVNIKVLPLPVEGRPSDFTGAVGQFEVQTSVEGQKFPVNQPFNLRIRFEGYGNAKMIDLPAIQWPDTVEIYDTKSESKFFKDGRSYKQFDILMIPRQVGVLSLPEINVSLFDPSTKKYYSKKTAAVDLEIVDNPNAPTGNLNSSPMAKESKEVPKGPALPSIVPEPHSSSVVASVVSQPISIAVAYGLALLMLLLKARSELGWGRRKKSLRELVEKRFKKVESALRSEDRKKVGAELMNVFYFLLGEATGQGGAVEEVDRLLDKVPPSVRRELGEPLRKAFESYQILCFAPEELAQTQGSTTQLKKLVKEARDLSQRILNALLSQTPEEKA